MERTQEELVALFEAHNLGSDDAQATPTDHPDCVLDHARTIQQLKARLEQGEERAHQADRAKLEFEARAEAAEKKAKAHAKRAERAEEAEDRAEEAEERAEKAKKRAEKAEKARDDAIAQLTLRAVNKYSLTPKQKPKMLWRVEYSQNRRHVLKARCQQPVFKTDGEFEDAKNSYKTWASRVKTPFLAGFNSEKAAGGWANWLLENTTDLEVKIYRVSTNKQKVLKAKPYCNYDNEFLIYLEIPDENILETKIYKY
ncbi:hypothetical protein PR003_g23940 [Phytophthora rubi]|uniref:Uncharacterized protein n=1 Tax=Phytophthora rubi TaxID=129364 RepID=A0A6A3J5U4_9STRA|nr:hypothetical protein PR002_g23225 [Phytophthora rubi]KAE8986833.1 hypothetical protein PR001_g22487 [Phytophthora rubi]KAE9295715.1 hypothetical protein PR003_g23940 [Phytophthora rubi]